MINLYYGEIETPIGTLVALSNGTELLRIDYGSFSDNGEKLSKWSMRHFQKESIIHAPEKISEVKAQLKAYFQKDRQEFELEYSLHGTDFQKKVWKALVNEIPYGRALSYKEIAIAIGNPKAVRAVGGAINKNPLSIVMPCHRVMGSNGKLVGYNGGLDKKEYLLKHEEILP